MLHLPAKSIKATLMDNTNGQIPPVVDSPERYRLCRPLGVHVHLGPLLDRHFGLDGADGKRRNYASRHHQFPN